LFDFLAETQHFQGTLERLPLVLMPMLTLLDDNAGVFPHRNAALPEAWQKFATGWQARDHFDGVRHQSALGEEGHSGL